MKSATRVVASTLGVLVGLAGIEHGLLEVLQWVAPAAQMSPAHPDQLRPVARVRQLAPQAAQQQISADPNASPLSWRGGDAFFPQAPFPRENVSFNHSPIRSLSAASLFSQRHYNTAC